MKTLYVVFLSCLLLSTVGCVVERVTEQDKLSGIVKHIPIGSTPVKYLGNNWYVSEVKGELFLYRKLDYTLEGQLITHIGTQNKELKAELEAIEVK